MDQTKTERALMGAWDWVGSYEGIAYSEDVYHDTVLLHSAWKAVGPKPTVAKVLKAYDFPEDIVLAYEYLTKRLDARNL